MQILDSTQCNVGIYKNLGEAGEVQANLEECPGCYQVLSGSDFQFKFHNLLIFNLMNKFKKNAKGKDQIMTEPKIKPTVKLIDTNGNAFVIIGRVKDALLKAGADKEYGFRYQDEVMCGDYENLLCVTMDYVHVT